MTRPAAFALVGTEILGVTYDYATHVGRLYLPPFCCTDMTGAIRFFRRLDPAVIQIDTIAGEALDTRYVRTATGQWTAITMNLQRRGR